jgi:hydrogenase expression/formation protein HypC
MCLGIPGKVVEIHEQDDLPMGKVEFGGILKDVCLSYTPEAQVGDYVLVHVGFAISRMDEAEARETFELIAQIEEEASGRLSAVSCQLSVVSAKPQASAVAGVKPHPNPLPPFPPTTDN